MLQNQSHENSNAVPESRLPREGVWANAQRVERGMMFPVLQNLKAGFMTVENNGQGQPVVSQTGFHFQNLNSPLGSGNTPDPKGASSRKYGGKGKPGLASMATARDEMASKKILIVDDEKELLGLVSLHMRMAGFQVLQASDGETAIKTCEESKPDLVILDLMLPELDGWEVCRILRENPETQNIPVMILTARAEVDDRLRGFDLGADDYVTKPFSPRELVARVKRILDRCHARPKSQKNIVSGYLEIDTEFFEVRMKGHEVFLTEKEKAILKLLVSRSGELITHEQLIDEVWGQDRIVEYGNIAVHVRHLREKIEEDPGHPKIIKTIKGMGYRFDFE